MSSQPTCRMMGRVVTASASKGNDPACHFLIFPSRLLSSFVQTVRFSPAPCSLSGHFLSSMTGPPKHNEKRSQTLLSNTLHTHTLHTQRRGRLKVSLLLLVFFWILTQILSVCPLLCSSHDSARRRNSGRREKEAGAQGLEVEERTGGDRVEGKH